jgi:hypothetical protein
MAWRLGVAERCTLQASTRCNVQSTATPSCSPQGNDPSWQQAALHVALLKYMLGQGAYQIIFYEYNFEQDFVWRISRCRHDNGPGPGRVPRPGLQSPPNISNSLSDASVIRGVVTRARQTST